MFVLDTNVLSAMMVLKPLIEVAAGIAAQEEEQRFTTSVSRAEIASAPAIIGDGRRRHDLAATAHAMSEEVEERILPFDSILSRLHSRTRRRRVRGRRPDPDKSSGGVMTGSMTTKWRSYRATHRSAEHPRASAIH